MLLGVFLLSGAFVTFVAGVWLSRWIGVPLGVMTGLMVTMIVFGRRVEKAAYAQVEGQAGAAAAALQMLRRGWDVKPAIAFTKNQDVVHRVVGRPGIVLVGEGNPHRVRNLLAVERKKHARLADASRSPRWSRATTRGGARAKLVRHVQKLPKNDQRRAT